MGKSDSVRGSEKKTVVVAMNREICVYYRKRRCSAGEQTEEKNEIKYLRPMQVLSFIFFSFEAPCSSTI